VQLTREDEEFGDVGIAQEGCCVQRRALLCILRDTRGHVMRQRAPEKGPRLHTAEDSFQLPNFLKTERKSQKSGSQQQRFFQKSVDSLGPKWISAAWFSARTKKPDHFGL